MRLLVCGDRNWSDRDFIYRVLSDIDNATLPPQVKILIEGEARGADSIARDWAEDLDIEVEAYPAEWEKHGKAAGPIRNLKMLNEGEPDLVVGFHDNIASSRGTKHMLVSAMRAGLEVRLYSHKWPDTYRIWDKTGLHPA